MARIPNKHGGGAQTNRNGLHFEQTTSLNDVYSMVWNFIQILDRNEAEQFVSQITGKIISKNDLMHVVDVIDNLNHRNWVLE